MRQLLKDNKIKYVSKYDENSGSEDGDQQVEGFFITQGADNPDV